MVFDPKVAACFHWSVRTHDGQTIGSTDLGADTSPTTKVVDNYVSNPSAPVLDVRVSINSAVAEHWFTRHCVPS